VTLDTNPWPINSEGIFLVRLLAINYIATAFFIRWSTKKDTQSVIEELTGDLVILAYRPFKEQFAHYPHLDEDRALEIVNEVLQETRNAIFIEHSLGPSTPATIGVNGVKFTDQTPGFQNLVTRYIYAFAYSVEDFRPSDKDANMLMPIQMNILESMKVVNELLR
ncbi:MAG: hypothetical protein ABGY11_12520, partial [Candidatus Thioglobus sp.]